MVRCVSRKGSHRHPTGLSTSWSTLLLDSLRQRYHLFAEGLPPILIESAHEAFVGRNKLAIVLDRQGKVDTIVSGMIQLDRQTGRDREQRPHRQQFHVGTLKDP